MKGIIYLADCSTKDNPSRPGTFILKSPFKEYILISLSETPHEDITSWRNCIDNVIENSKLFKDTEVIEGWFQKKGGIGHQYKNWKNRYFILKGNLLLYYSEHTRSIDIRKLKGFIELSQITDIEDDVSSDSNGFQFVITINNDKSYILSTKNFEHKKRWVNCLRDRISMIEKLQLPTSFNTLNNEHIIKSGKLQRSVDLKKKKENLFVLTNVYLRVYSSKVDVSTVQNNWSKGIIDCIPLIGCTIQYRDENEETHYLSPNQMALIDVQGNAYLLESKDTNELMDWAKSIKMQVRNLTKHIIEAGEVIRLTCKAYDKNNVNAGYTIMTIDESNLTLKYLMLNKEVIIPFSSLKLVYVQQTFLFCLKYVHGNKAKQLKMKCRNAIGIFDTVDAVFENIPTGKKFQKRGKALKHEEYEENIEIYNNNNSDRMTRELFLKNRKTLNEDEINEMSIKAESDEKKIKAKKSSSKGGRSNRNKRRRRKGRNTVHDGRNSSNKQSPRTRKTLN